MGCSENYRTQAQTTSIIIPTRFETFIYCLSSFYDERHGWSLFNMRASKGLMRLSRNRERATEDSHKTRNKKVRQTKHDNWRNGRQKLELSEYRAET